MLRMKEEALVHMGCGCGLRKRWVGEMGTLLFALPSLAFPAPALLPLGCGGAKAVLAGLNKMIRMG